MRPGVGVDEQVVKPLRVSPPSPERDLQQVLLLELALPTSFVVVWVLALTVSSVFGALFLAPILLGVLLERRVQALGYHGWSKDLRRDLARVVHVRPGVLVTVNAGLWVLALLVVLQVVLVTLGT
jgi:hypothetical protein